MTPVELGLGSRTLISLPLLLILPGPGPGLLLLPPLLRAVPDGVSYQQEDYRKENFKI